MSTLDDEAESLVESNGRLVVGVDLEFKAAQVVPVIREVDQRRQQGGSNTSPVTLLVNRHSNRPNMRPAPRVQRQPAMSDEPTIEFDNQHPLAIGGRETCRSLGFGRVQDLHRVRCDETLVVDLGHSLHVTWNHRPDQHGTHPRTSICCGPGNDDVRCREPKKDDGKQQPLEAITRS